MGSRCYCIRAIDGNSESYFKKFHWSSYGIVLLNLSFFILLTTGISLIILFYLVRWDGPFLDQSLVHCERTELL